MINFYIYIYFGESLQSHCLYCRYLGHDFDQTLAKIGTTAEVLAYKEESDEQSGISTLRVKAVGRQRFEIQETRRQTDGLV